jgi:hypothetical protein
MSSRLAETIIPCSCYLPPKGWNALRVWEGFDRVAIAPRPGSEEALTHLDRVARLQLQGRVGLDR